MSDTVGTGRRSIAVSGHVDAPVEKVWPLIGEAARWSEWTALTHTYLEREGEPAPDGVGAIRRFKMGPGGSREEVLGWEPPNLLVYTILSGFPVKNYRAEVKLSPKDGGTDVNWSATFDEPIPGSAPVLSFVLKRMYGYFVGQLKRRAPSAA